MWSGVFHTPGLALWIVFAVLLIRLMMMMIMIMVMKMIIDHHADDDVDKNKTGHLYISTERS